MAISTPTTSTIPQITSDVLRRRLSEGRPVTIIDVRPAEQFSEWHVPQSINVPAYEALKEGQPGPLADFSASDDAPVVTVCGAGKTSRTAARLLREMGTPAYSLDGGLRAWSLAWNTAAADFPEHSARVVQVRRTGKGCLSYLVGSGDEALVIDPSLPADTYELLARQNNWRIIGVIETHIHADHLSRSRMLADHVGAPLHLPDQQRTNFPFRSVTEGDNLPVGETTLTALHTPGHTPESTTYRLGNSALFTGDTLFPEGVGRPDLDADAAEAQKKAGQLYESLRRISELPGDMLVLAGHASQPVAFDEEVIGASLAATIQGVEAFGWSRSRFIDEITSRLPPAPPNHESVVAHNESGELPDEEEQMDLEAGANRCAVK